MREYGIASAEQRGEDAADQRRYDQRADQPLGDEEVPRVSRTHEVHVVPEEGETARRGIRKEANGASKQRDDGESIERRERRERVGRGHPSGERQGT